MTGGRRSSSVQTEDERRGTKTLLPSTPDVWTRQRTAPIRTIYAAEPLPLDDPGFRMLIADCYPHLTYLRSTDGQRDVLHEWRSSGTGERTVLVLRGNGQHTVEQSALGCYGQLRELASLWWAAAAGDCVSTGPEPAIPNLVGALLEDVPTVPGIDHSRFSDLLASELPGVEHHRRALRRESLGGDMSDEHLLIHNVSGSVARLVVTWDRSAGSSRTQAASAGPRHLYEDVLAFMERWQRNGRPLSIGPHHAAAGAT
jgi:hypothetical protein